jgi:hypothetical protein
VSDLLSKAPFAGRVELLLVNPEPKGGPQRHERAELAMTFLGPEGDYHAGHTRLSDSRMLKQYSRGTVVRSARQISIVSVEEMAEVANRLGIPEILPEWVAANMVTSGIPDLTLLPPSTRLQFPSGAMIVVDIENGPCRYPASNIARHHPEAGLGFVTAARGKRGVVGWIEAEGVVRQGDPITLWLPPQRLYAHT